MTPRIIFLSIEKDGIVLWRRLTFEINDCSVRFFNKCVLEGVVLVSFYNRKYAVTLNPTHSQLHNENKCLGCEQLIIIFSLEKMLRLCVLVQQNRTDEHGPFWRVSCY